MLEGIITMSCARAGKSGFLFGLLHCREFIPIFSPTTNNLSDFNLFGKVSFAGRISCQDIVAGEP